MIFFITHPLLPHPSGFPMHPSTQRFIEAAATAGVPVTTVTFNQETRTAQQAADAVGCEVAQIVKSLCFIVDGHPTMIFVSGKNQMDEKKLAKLCGVGRGKVKRANADQVKAATGYSIGGVSPFGLVTEMALYMDEDLLTFPTVWAAAGMANTVFEIESAQLQQKTGALIADVKK